METYNLDFIQRTSVPTNGVVSSKIVKKENKDMKMTIGKGNIDNIIPKTMSVSSKEFQFFKVENDGVTKGASLNGNFPSSEDNGLFMAELKLGSSTKILYATVSIFSRNNLIVDADKSKYSFNDAFLVNSKNNKKMVKTNVKDNATVTIPLNSASAFDNNELTYHENSFMGTIVSRFIAYNNNASPKRIYASGIEVVPHTITKEAGKNEFLFWGSPDATPVSMGYAKTFDNFVSNPINVNGNNVLVGNYYSSSIPEMTSCSMVLADRDYPSDAYIYDAKVVYNAGVAYLHIYMKCGNKSGQPITPNTVFKISINN